METPVYSLFFFFQAEDGIRDGRVTGVQTCALPIWTSTAAFRRRLLRLGKTVVERVAGAADGADRILLAARIEQFAQPPDMHVHGALIDVDVAAPDRVEQLLAGKHPARMLQEEFQQAIFGRA